MTRTPRYRLYFTLMISLEQGRNRVNRQVNKPLESAIDIIKAIAEHGILKHRKKESQVQALREEMGYNSVIIVPSCQC